MQDTKPLRSRVEAAIERANLIDDNGEDLVSTFDARLAGLEGELETYKSQCKQLEGENRELSDLLDKLLGAVEQDRFGDVFKTASERVAAIAAALEEDISAFAHNETPAPEAPAAEAPGTETSPSEPSPRSKTKAKRSANKSSLTLISSKPEENGNVETGDEEDDDVAVMEVVERLSSLTHELADSESTG